MEIKPDSAFVNHAQHFNADDIDESRISTILPGKGTILKTSSMAHRIIPLNEFPKTLQGRVDAGKEG